MQSSEGITQLLVDGSQGNQQALDRLMPLVYDELRRQARNYLRHERQGHTLEPTALVNEAYLKLIDQRHSKWQKRAQFFAVAAQLMRRILVDHARQSRAINRPRGNPTPAESCLRACLPAECCHIDRLLSKLNSEGPDSVARRTRAAKSYPVFPNLPAPASRCSCT